LHHHQINFGLLTCAKNSWTGSRLVLLASQGHVTTCAECKTVNTALADDSSVWPWPPARITPCSLGRQAAYVMLLAKLWMK